MSKQENTNDKKIALKTVVISAMIIITAYIFLAAGLIYGFSADNKITRITASLVPYPAAVVNYTGFIRLGDLRENASSVKKFYESQDFSDLGMRVDFSTEEGIKKLKIKEKEILNKMIEDRIMEKIAGRKGVSVSREMVDQNVKRKLKEYNTENGVKENLARLYGWTLDDFKEKVIRPNLYREELKKVYQKESEGNALTVKAREKIGKAEAELKAGKEFSEAARNYSEGGTAESGGELGWFEKEQLIPDLAEAVAALSVGERSGIIESDLGFHIVELEEEKKENEQDLFRIRQVFVPKFDFLDWLESNMESFKVWIPLKDYYWDKDRMTVDFKNSSLKEFEQNIIQNPQSDPSVMF